MKKQLIFILSLLLIISLVAGATIIIKGSEVAIDTTEQTTGATLTDAVDEGDGNYTHISINTGESS